MIRQALAVLSVVFVTACGATSSHSDGQSELAAARKKYYKIDLTKEKDWSDEVNLMGDDMTDGYSGIAVLMPIRKEMYQVKMTKGEEATCKIEAIENTGAGSVIKLVLSTDVDNGDSFCDLEIRARDTRKGVIHFYSVGT